MSKGTQLTLLGVTAGVTVAVGHATEAPDETQTSRGGRVLKTGDQEGNHVSGKALQGVLVNTLLAVEDHLLLVLESLGLLSVHGGEGDTGGLTVASDLGTETGDENRGEDRDGNGLKKNVQLIASGVRTGGDC